MATMPRVKPVTKIEHLRHKPKLTAGLLGGLILVVIAAGVLLWVLDPLKTRQKSAVSAPKVYQPTQQQLQAATKNLGIAGTVVAVDDKAKTFQLKDTKGVTISFVYSDATTVHAGASEKTTDLTTIKPGLKVSVMYMIEYGHHAAKDVWYASN